MRPDLSLLPVGDSVAAAACSCSKSKLLLYGVQTACTSTEMHVRASSLAQVPAAKADFRRSKQVQGAHHLHPRPGSQCCHTQAPLSAVAGPGGLCTALPALAGA